MTVDLDEIKRGLRAEIKKRENEQYATFQCNVRQMCKDVLAKLEEQESEIAELKEQVHDYAQGLYVMQAGAEKDARHQKFMRCNLLIDYCGLKQNTCNEEKVPFWRKWYLRWCELYDKFKEAK